MFFVVNYRPSVKKQIFSNIKCTSLEKPVKTDPTIEVCQKNRKLLPTNFKADFYEKYHLFCSHPSFDQY